MDSFDILVIILSIMLALLLILAIMFTIFLIKVIRKINSLTDQAQNVMHNVESASRVFEKSARPVAISRIIANVVDMFRDDKSSKKTK
jgi:heme/copper-type cytochrome/quinol oxidase subunit 2